jgi:invasion protein IalB
LGVRGPRNADGALRNARSTGQPCGNRRFMCALAPAAAQSEALNSLDFSGGPDHDRPGVRGSSDNSFSRMLSWEWTMDFSRRAQIMGCALGALIGLAGTTAFAQQPPQQPDAPVAWRVECSGDGKVLECRAVQAIFQRETRQLLVSVVVRHQPNSKTPVMMIQLPLGLNLTEPLLIKVDNGPVEKQPIQTCTNIGCFAGMPVNDKLLAAMRSGKDLKLTLFDVNKKPVELALPLLGFGLALDRSK